MEGLLPRDERELGIDRTADRLSYLVLAFGLLGSVAWRSFVNHETPWDLLALVIAAGAAGTLYRLAAARFSGAGWSWLVDGRDRPRGRPRRSALGSEARPNAAPARGVPGRGGSDRARPPGGR